MKDFIIQNLVTLSICSPTTIMSWLILKKVNKMLRLTEKKSKLSRMTYERLMEEIDY